MKRIFFTLAALSAVAGVAAQSLQQQQFDADSLEIHEIQKIEVTATRATSNTPVAFENIAKEEIERNNFGLDIPSLLALTPSMIATNETGIGIGGTSIRLRGTDATRLNVTVNGVSMNNPDSHSMYWYDTPDLVSAVGDIQVQRGAGISTNGTGAFGGAVNMTTSQLSTEFGGSAAISYGSYNTNKQAVHISSGLLGNHWMVDGRLTHIGSDGYIERGGTDLKSYMLQGAYYNGNTMVKLVSFGGKAKTYLTYNGITKEEMELNGRRYNSSGKYKTADGLHYVFDSSKNKWMYVNYHDNETDNYLQINNQLIVSHQFNQKWSMNFTGFYTYGYGFYKQYKSGRSLHEYALTDDPDLEADLIRNKIMRNHLGGVNAAAFYNIKNLDVAFGGSWSYYTCPHWGTLDWVDGMDEADYKDVRWYDNSADKQDANLFAKANWQVVKGLRLFADLQYRYVHYKASGTNDNYADDGMQPIDINEQYNFFNPHLGIDYRLGDRHNFFASFAIAQKEPTRSDFTDRYMFSPDDSNPRPERMFDYEIGYRYTAPRLMLGVNLYYMAYKDQLIPTGMVNDGDDALNINVPKSYRRGIELSVAWQATKWFTLGGNATFSQNRIKDYVDLLAYSPTYGENLGTKTIAYSPSVMSRVFFDFHIKGFDAVLSTQYVSKQYFTNNENDALSLDRYCVTDLNLGYTLHTKAIRSVRFGVQIYNLFNTLYSSNGYGYSYMDTWSGDTPSRIDMAYYFPQAPLHALANVTVKF
ncbi:MAG: TonB-dependent receptor [Alistipes sp.]|nr:TonB-dependent receptor [Alistipes sp.]